MAKHFLEDFVKAIDPKAKFGSHKDVQEPWYNTEGDCIEYQTVNDAIVGDRVDEYLTIYRSVKTNEANGFVMPPISQGVKSVESSSGFCVVL